MSENTESESQEETTGDGGEETPAETKKWSGKKLTLFVFLPVVVVIGAGAGAFFSGLFDSGPMEAESGVEAGVVANSSQEAVFYDLPDMLVNLNTGSKKKAYLKLAISLELNHFSDISNIERVLPRIMDSLQIFVREMRSEDLTGSAGMYRLKEKILRRANIAVHPIQIKDVLFKELLIQ